MTTKIWLNKWVEANWGEIDRELPPEFIPDYVIKSYLMANGDVYTFELEDSEFLDHLHQELIYE